MFTIGDFARHGRVSVRMLRHYDAIGLLRPARVDPFSGYRFYEAGQLARLNRVIALKDLGFTLQQVQAIVDEEVSAEELRGMLRLRRAELEAAAAAATTRLAQVEARLRTIESEGRMSTHDVVVKSVPAVRVARLSTRVASFGPEDIGPVAGPLFDELCRRLAAAGVTPTGPGVQHYEDAPDGGGIVVHVAFPVGAAAHGEDGGEDRGEDFEVVDLPAVPTVATVVHHGSMDDIVPTAQTLARWIDANGYRSTGYAREVYLAYGEGDPAGWVTEIQEPVTEAG
ncbi:MerR family transcriptional regulator [Streptomyces sp. SCA3-4]|uniref:MerR family transcriptional regulator n=1 Tax=Streptomyces sichuanensis TaxID=2871810 RepID=UPI001CE2DE64|nr:MerR family transcriptional regulator [Streptomyces sichuanensis]MCA6092144.1 MerR family transcriptional regulator [Streptomyces sichuanensis]